MIAPWTRVAELRRLVDEVAVVDWNDRAWWAVMAAAAAAETIADLRPRQIAADLIHDVGPGSDTMMAWPALPPRNLAEAIAVVVLNADTHAQLGEQARNMRLAMDSRAVIEQAKGVLMAQRHIDADQAFDVLREASQRYNRKLRDIATGIVESTQDRSR